MAIFLYIIFVIIAKRETSRRLKLISRESFLVPLSPPSLRIPPNLISLNDREREEEEEEEKGNTPERLALEYVRYVVWYFNEK